MKGLGLGLGLSGDGGGASFTPTTLFTGTTGLWYDASDASTLFQDTAGTTPALVASGHPVGRVNDKSPHGVNATQGTAGARPVLATNGAGKTVIRFDGVDDKLSYSGLSLGSNVSTIAVVGQVRTDNASEFVCGNSQVSVQSWSLRWGTYAGFPIASADYSFGTRSVFIIRVRAANDFDLITNGATENFTNGAAIAGQPASLANDGGGGFTDLDLEELLIFDRALSNGEVTSLNTYLATKHGL